MFTTAHSRLVALPKTARAIVAAAALGAYIAACLALYPYLGQMALTLVGLPVTLVAWLLGLRAGLVATLLTIPLNTFLLNVVGEPGWDALLRQGNWPGLVSLLVIAIAIGRLHDLQEQAKGITERLGRILDETSTEIYIFDAVSFRYLQASAGARRSLGYTMPELACMTPIDLLPDLGDRGFHALIERTRRARSAQTVVESRQRRKDGSLYPVEVRWQLSHAENPPVFVALVQDITARKRAEAEAQRAMELEQQKETAESANQAKGEFLATMSHEIRTPMNGIIGMTEMLLGTGLTSEQREYAGIVRDSANGLLTIINDILDFSKIEAGKFMLDVADFDPCALVETSVEPLLAEAHQKRIVLLTYVAPKVPPRLRGDAGRLRQVLLNLTGNAVKFTDQGEVSVSVRAEVVTPEHVTLRFAVRDMGVGLSPAACSRLFQPYSQADSTTARRFGGTGLGLTISKRLVELMGGQIGVDSVEGQGSTFWFTVPLEHATTEVDPPAAPPVFAASRALIVSESGASREILHSYLKEWGIRNDDVAMGEAALTSLRRAADTDPYNLVFVEANLSGMDAFALQNAVLRDPQLGRTRLLLLTAYGETALVEAAAQAGFAGSVSKPTKRSILWQTLIDALADNAQPARAAGPALPGTTTNLIGATAAPAGDSNCRVLVAEDNPVNQKLALLQLRKLGYTGDPVSSGCEAVAAAATGKYGIVLMDCQMPEMDGFEATAAIRRAERQGGRPRIPIVAMTANAMQGDRDACLAAGMDDYLAKPVNNTQLSALLERWRPDHVTPNQLDGRMHVTDKLERTIGTAPLDPKALASLRALEPDGALEFLDNLIDLFMADTPRILEAMRTAVIERDAAGLYRAAHRFRGSSANFGATHLVGFCEELERLGRAGTTVGAGERLQQVEAEYARVIAALEEERAHVPA